MGSESMMEIRTRREPVASYRHFLLFLALVAAVILIGYAGQQRPGAGGGSAESHPDTVPMYLSAAALDWLLVYFVWRGVRRRGGTFRSLVGGRWAGARDILRDVAIAFGFWGALMVVVWILDLVVGPGGDKNLEALLPRTPGEVAAWMVTSASAGFCEEFVFRGYVQRQLLALTQLGWLAILGQGLLFGLMHAYQGWLPVLRICVIGIMLGALAAWRRSLRPGMIAHAWQDIWAGWLSIALRSS